MHTAWQVEDIRFLDFEHLDPRDLALLARTCKSFFYFATDALWKTLTSITPLIRLLPSDLRRRRLRVDDVHRLDFYATEVKNLCFENETPDIAVVWLPPEFNPAKKANWQGRDGHKLWEPCGKR
jgi:F-box-like